MMLRGLSRVSNNLTDGLCLREKAFHETYVAGHFKFIVRIPREHYVSGLRQSSLCPRNQRRRLSEHL